MPCSVSDSDSGPSASNSNEDRDRGNDLLQQYRTAPHGKLRNMAHVNLERYVEACQDAELLRGWLRDAGGDALLSEMLDKRIEQLRPDKYVCVCSM